MNEELVLFDFLLRLGDDRLILGHRVSEWCGHAPILEEDIALANIALDCIGQSALFLALAAKVENQERDEDDLAYGRDVDEFRNVLLVEQPNQDFAYTITRQFFYDSFAVLLYEALQKSTHEELKGLAAKALKETKYHLRHSTSWMLRLGDGTEESRKRMQEAVNHLWNFTGELFLDDVVSLALVQQGITCEMASLAAPWRQQVAGTLTQATLEIPAEQTFQRPPGRAGHHSEQLKHILDEMQFLPRAYPDAQW